MIRGVYPPYTLSGQTSKKKHFVLCLSSLRLHCWLARKCPATKVGVGPASSQSRSLMGISLVLSTQWVWENRKKSLIIYLIVMVKFYKKKVVLCTVSNKKWLSLLGKCLFFAFWKWDLKVTLLCIWKYEILPVPPPLVQKQKEEKNWQIISFYRLSCFIQV